MDYHSDHTLWGSRNRLEKSLGMFELTVFDWLCLERSSREIQWDYGLGESIYEDVVKEEFWGDSGVYLPDISLEIMRRADLLIRSSGLVRHVDRELAAAILNERRAFDTSFDTDMYSSDKFLGLRVLSESGFAVWKSVREMQGYWQGNRFIRLLAHETHGAAMVIHSAHEFDLALLCSECAQESTPSTLSPLLHVGPWFSKGQLWLEGWRLICPHLS